MATEPKKKRPFTLANTDVRPYVYGGLAACVAEALTFPIDTAKTRLQLQGQKIDSRYSLQTPYEGMLNVWKRIIREEGFSRLYRGLSPALLRQASYGTIKFGLYYSVKEHMPGKEGPLRNVASAVFAGSVSSAIANPTDVLKVRLQSQIAATSSVTLVAGFREISSAEGIRGLWRGVIPTAERAAIVAGVQLPVYDYVKAYLLRNKMLTDGAANHLVSSFLAGAMACLVSSPIDVVRTRFMSQRRSDSRVYRNSFHCAFLTIKTEGIRALYKGVIPAFMRMGPWNVVFFLVYERLKKTITD